LPFVPESIPAALDLTFADPEDVPVCSLRARSAALRAMSAANRANSRYYRELARCVRNGSTLDAAQATVLRPDPKSLK